MLTPPPDDPASPLPTDSTTPRAAQAPEADALCADPQAHTRDDAAEDRPRLYVAEGDAVLATPRGADALAVLRAYRAAHPRTPPDALVLPVYADTFGVAGEPECTVLPEPPATVLRRPDAPTATAGHAPAAAQGAPRPTLAGAYADPTPTRADLVPPVPPAPITGTPAPRPPDERAALDAYRAHTLGRVLPVVAFAGPRGSGKDAACFALPHAPEDGAACGHGWVRVALAGELKRRVAFVFGTPWTALVGPSAAREAPGVVYDDWRARWDAAFGPALFTYPWSPRGGALRVAEGLHLRERIALARERVQTMIAEHLAEHDGTISARLLCQWIGTDYARAVDDSVWLARLWCTYAELCRGAGYSASTGVTDAGPCYLPAAFDATRDDLAGVPRHYLPAPFDGPSCGAASNPARGMVVSDVRFPNEVSAILAGPPWLAGTTPGPAPVWRHGAVWWLDAEGAPWCPPRMAHPSEPTFADLAGLVTGVIPNRPIPGVPLTPPAPHLAALRDRVRGAVGAFVASLRAPTP